MATPHNEATINGIAKTVLMPGDPRRAEFIAENFLEYPQLVKDVRGVHGYTGIYKDVPITVMASGMGIPSIGIYSWELYSEYDVDNIIRIGSAGALQDDLNLMDIIIAQGACTTSNYTKNFGLDGTFAPIADFNLMAVAAFAAKDMGLHVHIGNLLSSDNFYSAFELGKAQNEEWKKMGVLGIEMEAAGLYTNAAYWGKRALCICTVSDHLFKSDELSSEERQTGFSTMIKLALESAVRIQEIDEDLYRKSRQK